MNINWDAKGYKENFSFVHEYGEDVISLLKSPKGAAVLDLGCGNGALSAKLLEKGSGAARRSLPLCRITRSAGG